MPAAKDHHESSVRRVVSPQIATSRADVFRRDVTWNLASFAVVAAAGVLANIVIARAYGPAALGAFNQVLALYIVCSQISTAGIHLAVLQRVSAFVGEAGATADQSPLRSIISISIVNVSVIALAVVVIGYALSGVVAIIFHSQDAGRAWEFILPGLWFFSLNKVLLNVINGLRHMRTFAIAQAARYLLMTALLLGFVLFAVGSDKLTLTVTLSEAALFVALAVYVSRLHPLSHRLFDRVVARDQLVFGMRGMWGNAFTELNTRVDVIILGIFTTDRVVGIYTLVAMIFEGLFQCLIVLRNVFNPRVALLFAGGRIEEFRTEFRRIAAMAYVGTLVLAAVAVAFYPLFIDWVIRDSSFHEGYWSLIVLMVGLWIVSGWLPLDMLLVQSGDPTGHSLLKVVTVAANVVVTTALVPFFGMIAAAVGCSISLVLSIVWLKLLVRHRLGVSI